MAKITYKQLADELGVSKEKIRYQAKKLPEACVLKEDGVIYLTEQGAAKVREALSAGSAQAVPEPPKEASTVDLLRDTLETLKKQLEEKDAQLRAKDVQLAEKDKQIADLTEAVKSQADSIKGEQALHAGTMKKQLTGEVACDEVSVEASKTPKWMFWKK